MKPTLWNIALVALPALATILVAPDELPAVAAGTALSIVLVFAVFARNFLSCFVGARAEMAQAEADSLRKELGELRGVLQSATSRDERIYGILADIEEKVSLHLANGATGPEESAKWIARAENLTGRIVVELKPVLPPHEWTHLATVDSAKVKYERRDKVTPECADHWVALYERRTVLRTLLKEYAPHRSPRVTGP